MTFRKHIEVESSEVISLSGSVLGARDLSENKTGIKQGTISRMLNKKYIPHDQTTIAVIRVWVKQTNDQIELQEKSLILDKD